MISEDRLTEISERFHFLEAAMAEGNGNFTALAKEYSELQPIVDRIGHWRKLRSEISQTKTLLDDPEMKALAGEELATLRTSLAETELALKTAFLPADAADTRPAMLEIRPGTGGEEAALFAGDLLRMYRRYAEIRGWSFDILGIQHTGLGGVKEAIVLIRGENVFARLKYESGVHRVQRIPATESGGRIHTSAATVAVLPEAGNVDIDIEPNDIRVETMRSSGAGGQHVNTTDSAVRITHIPTGIQATSSEKSQHRNRDIAMQMLRTRLYDLERSRADSERSADRAAQVGSGDRSERIRTYNFPQGRMTDHRINLTLHRLEDIMHGELDEVIDALAVDAQARLLSAMET